MITRLTPLKLLMARRLLEAQWRFVTPILDGWVAASERRGGGRPETPALAEYAAGSWGPAAANALVVADGRAWRRL